MSIKHLPLYKAHDTEVDILIVGSGTGLAAALSAHKLGLKTLVVEKTQYVGGSTALSGGAFWIPANPVLKASKAQDSIERAREYLTALVGEQHAKRWQAFLDNADATVQMLLELTDLEFTWIRGYSDYHPELPGGSAASRSCEAKPFDANTLGHERERLRPAFMQAPVPMPVTGADYRWLNLMMKKPLKAVPKMAFRALQGIGGAALGKDMVAGGQALAAGMFAGVKALNIPIWTETSVVDLEIESGEVKQVVVSQRGKEYRVRVNKGAILAAGGFDHDLAMRQKYQSPAFVEDLSLGSEGNTGDLIKIMADKGAQLDLMDQSWWFPAVAPVPGGTPQVLLAERSLPGSLIINQDGERFINEAIDYMSFGQKILELEAAGRAVKKMWLIFDQSYRNSYLFAGQVYPGMDLPSSWYEAQIAAKADSVAQLAQKIQVPYEALQNTLQRFNSSAAAGIDNDFKRGNSAYDRYYGDPTITPNPNLRALNNSREEGKLYAVQVVLSDLGTCGGLKVNENAEVLNADNEPINGLYAIGNTAANVFAKTYPGAGATIAQGLVFGYVAAKHAAGR